MTDSPTPSIEAMLSQFGATERLPLSRIQVIGGRMLHKNWNDIPHVTHNDLLDVGVLEDCRRVLNQREGVAKLTPLPMLMKALAATLSVFPRFKAALDTDGQHIIARDYCHLGFAIDTEKGLLVAVVNDCDTKSIDTIQSDIVELSEKARSKGLSAAEMAGGCFSVSSLGQIGGTSFTPIINTHQVAILGVSRLVEVPERGDDDQIVWRKKLPVSLSYDHRVINGADAGRFLAELQQQFNHMTQSV